MSQQPPAEPAGVPAPRSIYVEHPRFMDAIVLNKESVKRFYEIASAVLRASSVTSDPTCSVSRSNGTKSEVGLEQLLNDRNPKAEALKAVRFKAKHGDVSVEIRIHDAEHTIDAEAASHNLEALKEFKKAVSLEVGNVRALHSPVRILLVEFRKSNWPKILYWSGVGIWLLGVLIILLQGLSSVKPYGPTLIPPREDLEKPKPTQPDLKPTKQPVSSKKQGGVPGWLINAAIGAGWVLLVIGSIWGLYATGVVLFPTIVFDIGEGRDRYALIRWWRLWVLGSLLLSSFVVRLGMLWAFGI